MLLLYCSCIHLPTLPPNVQGPNAPRPDPSQEWPEPSSLRESAAQSSEAARRSATDLWTSLRATYNSVAETISELDFRPLGRQASFVRLVTAVLCLFNKATGFCLLHLGLGVDARLGTGSFWGLSSLPAHVLCSELCSL